MNYFGHFFLRTIFVIKTSKCYYRELPKTKKYISTFCSVYMSSTNKQIMFVRIKWAKLKLGREKKKKKVENKIKSNEIWSPDRTRRK